MVRASTKAKKNGAVSFSNYALVMNVNKNIQSITSVTLLTTHSGSGCVTRFDGIAVQEFFPKSKQDWHQRFTPPCSPTCKRGSVQVDSLLGANFNLIRSRVHVYTDYKPWVYICSWSKGFLAGLSFGRAYFPKGLLLERIWYFKMGWAWQ